MYEVWFFGSVSNQCFMVALHLTVKGWSDLCIQSFQRSFQISFQHCAINEVKKVWLLPQKIPVLSEVPMLWISYWNKMTSIDRYPISLGLLPRTKSLKVVIFLVTVILLLSWSTQVRYTNLINEAQ